MVVLAMVAMALAGLLKPGMAGSSTRIVPAAIAMKVVTVESTPNPSAFLIRLDDPLSDVATDGLRGRTFRKGRGPLSLTAALATEGVSSILVVGKLLTISKDAQASWEMVLPPVVEALGGAAEALAASESLLPASAAGLGEAPVMGAVTIRLQVSQRMPIQVEAAGWSGQCPPVRAKLSARFGNAMALLIDQSGDAFFKGRAWIPRGLRYPELDGGGDAFEDERLAIGAALESELADVEAAFPDDRLASLIHGSKASERASLQVADGDANLLTLEAVDRLVEQDAAYEAKGEAGMTDALRRLAAFVATGRGLTGARRDAIAYLGGTAGRGGDTVFDAVVSAFKDEKVAGLRRTAGDALSDLGDERAAPIAMGALADRSTLPLIAC